MYTMQLNQAVKRNIDRFPQDFMCKLTQTEKDEVITICDNLNKLKFSPHLPHAFTEHGVAMLSSVLRSPRAVQVNIFIIRAFIKLREMFATNKDLAQRVDILEREQYKQGENIRTINTIIKQLIDEPIRSKEKIGFRQN